MVSTAPGFRGKTILLVDDDVMLREVLARALVDAGYPVLTAEDGEQALALVRTLNGQLGLVITDVRMPVMDGLKLADNLTSLPTAPPVLFISGFAESNELPGPFLAKPFLPSALLEQVARMVSAPVH
jgi:two-component system cell cycle sensor histidine kinase/response regulator CckA